MIAHPMRIPVLLIPLFLVSLFSLFLFVPSQGIQASTTQANTPSLSLGESMEQKKPLIILIGAPGSGKGTQASDIVQTYGVVHISTGDMLRAEIRKESALGSAAKSYIDQGKLVPDSLIIDMLQARMAEPDCLKGVLLDGFPRTVQQAESLQKNVEGKFHVTALFLDVSDDTVVARITGRQSCPSCGSIFHSSYKPPKEMGICDVCGTKLVTRNDDKEETVRARLKVFHDQTAPVIEYYKGKNLLHRINGENSSELVKKECLESLEKEFGKPTNSQ